ncbi:MAG: MarR family transcriptional regulator, partial [Oxalobacteraceae bacterium]
RAESLYRERRRRDLELGEPRELFGEPSWDILLDLFIARGRARPVSVSSACIASSTPQSTALRYVGVLEKVGLVQRAKDPRDARRQYLELTDIGLSKMTAYLAE